MLITVSLPKSRFFKSWIPSNISQEIILESSKLQSRNKILPQAKPGNHSEWSPTTICPSSKTIPLASRWSIIPLPWVCCTFFWVYSSGHTMRFLGTRGGAVGARHHYINSISFTLTNHLGGDESPKRNNMALMIRTYRWWATAQNFLIFYLWIVECWYERKYDNQYLYI